MFKRMVDVESSVIAAKIMTDPAPVAVHVGHIGMPFHIAEVIAVFDTLWRRIMSGRTMRGNEASSNVNIVLSPSSAILGVAVCKETKRSTRFLQWQFFSCLNSFVDNLQASTHAFAKQTGSA